MQRYFDNLRFHAGKILKIELPIRALIIFLIANALKTATIYNYFDASHSIGFFLLHFVPSLLFSAIIFLLALKFGSRILFSIIYLTSIIFLLANLLFFAHFNNFIHLNHLKLVMLEGLQLIIGQSFIWNYFCFIVLVDLPGFLYLLKLFPDATSAVNRLTTQHRIIFQMGSLLVLTHGIIFSFGTFYNPPAKNENDLDRQIVLQHGLLAHNVIDALKGSNSKLNSDYISYGRVLRTKASDSGPCSIIMIQVESLDAFIVNHRHRGSYVAPFLHLLSQRSIYYPYVLTTRRAGVTSDCELSVLNSIEPFELYPSMLSDTYTFPNAITKRLPKSAYDISAFHGNRGSFYNREKAYPKMGFKKFFDIDAMGLKESGWGASDHDVFSFAEKKLEEMPDPLFFYLITMSSHEPFQSPLHYYSTDKYDDITDSLTRNYFRSISYVDGELEKFVRRASDLHPDAYIFIYGDHTPFALSNNQFHRAYFLQNSLEFEFVPLFIITPDHRKAQEQASVASFLDFEATILSASGVPAAINSNGTDLLMTPIRESSVLLHNVKHDRKTLFQQIDRISPEK